MRLIVKSRRSGEMEVVKPSKRWELKRNWEGQQVGMRVGDQEGDYSALGFALESTRTDGIEICSFLEIGFTLVLSP